MKSRKSKLRKGIVICLVIVALFIFSSRGMKDKIPTEEQGYIDTVLVQITSESTKEEVFELLGKPSRNIGLKINWNVIINEKKSRIGVYFSPEEEKATKVVLDGGVGRFYYRKDL